MNNNQDEEETVVGNPCKPQQRLSKKDKNGKNENNTMVHNIINGDYRATVYLDKFLIDKGTMAQIHKMLVHPATNHMRIMPDCHRGSGCCVGYTSYLTTKIVPKFIGGDIGCGMICYKIDSKYITTNLKTEKNIAKIKINNMSLSYIDSRIRKLIPMGSGRDSVFQEEMLDINTNYLNKIWEAVSSEAYQFAEQYKQKYNHDIYEHIPEYSWEWFLEKCKEVGADYKYDLLSLGTLGGGNHFIELNYSDDYELYVTIHSGSRDIGQKICRYHQNKINDTKYFDRDKYNNIKKKTSRHYQGKQFYQIMEDIRLKLLGERHADYLEKEEAYQYYFDMIFAQHFAQLNRYIMLRNVLNVIQSPRKPIKISSNKMIESIHNYIDFDDFIVRKGAIRASKDKECVIALNMRDGILICTGKGNSEWNYSAAHGAGRVINRQEAYNKLRLNHFKREMKDIYSSSVVLETLDESPMVYKDINLIKKALLTTVNINQQLKPIINMKGLN